MYYDRSWMRISYCNMSHHPHPGSTLEANPVSLTVIKTLQDRLHSPYIQDKIFLKEFSRFRGFARIFQICSDARL